VSILFQVASQLDPLTSIKYPRFKQNIYLFSKNHMKWFRNILLLLLTVVVFWWVWSLVGRVGNSPLRPAPNLSTIEVVNFGNPGYAAGNIIGMQPLLTTLDYANEASFYQALRVYMQKAKAGGLLNEKTIVVFPEYIGSWLVAANEKKKVYDESATITDALTLQVVSNLFSYVPAYFNSGSADKTKEAVFRMKQPVIATIYQSVFSKLSAEFKVTMVAGSAVLADPVVSEQGIITTGKGKLYNTSAVFDANGKVMKPLIKKIFPISDEKGFTCAADSAQVPLFNTPAGRLAVLVCADSWFPAAYKNLNNKADVIAIPSLGGPDTDWTAPWNGYNGAEPPADVDTTADYHHISEGDAWIKYAMAKRAPAAGIHNGMNVFFTGKMWDMKPEGRVLTLQNDSLHVSSPAINKGRITNLWFNNHR
jgi:predicted amidohydrolase